MIPSYSFFTEYIFSQDAYSSPVRAALAVISLTAGDIDMNELFYSDAESPSDDSSSSSSPPSPEAAPGRQYQELGFTIWLAAVVIMSLLFNNLLVRGHKLSSPLPGDKPA